jgi:hypothetical protein
LTRKPTILAALILLLLIGGGGVAFYFHLRKQAQQEFAEVDGFLRTLPPSTGWTLHRADERVVKVAIGPKWLKSVGIRPRQEHLRTHYSYFFQAAPGAAVFVTRRSGRITDVVILGRSADVERMKELLLGKHPDLQPHLRLYPH